jgi:hypothetical protein
MTRFFAAWVTQAAVGWGGGAQDADAAAGVFDDREYVQACAVQGESLEEVAGEQSAGLGTEEGRPGGRGVVVCWVDSGIGEDLPDGGRGDLDLEYT